MVRGETHIAGNRLDLVMTDAPDVVDVSLVTPLDTSDHCFVNCELLVEQVIPEHNISSSSSRTDRWVDFQQNTVLRLFVHTRIMHGIDECYQLTETFGGFSAQCLSKLFLKEFTVLMLTTSLGRAFQVVVILIG